MAGIIDIFLKFISISCGSDCNLALCVISKNEGHCKLDTFWKIVDKITKIRDSSTLPVALLRAPCKELT